MFVCAVSEEHTLQVVGSESRYARGLVTEKQTEKKKSYRPTAGSGANAFVKNSLALMLAKVGGLAARCLTRYYLLAQANNLSHKTLLT